MANGTLKVSNIQTSSGSGTITLGQSGETIALGATTNNLLTPTFFIIKSATQAISASTLTKVTFDGTLLKIVITFSPTTNLLPTNF